MQIWTNPQIPVNFFTPTPSTTFLEVFAQYFVITLVKEKCEADTAWKVSKYLIFSGPYFPVFGLNTWKYGPKITPYLDTSCSERNCVQTWFLRCRSSRKFLQHCKESCRAEFQLRVYKLIGTIRRSTSIIKKLVCIWIHDVLVISRKYVEVYLAI